MCWFSHVEVSRVSSVFGTKFAVGIEVCGGPFYFIFILKFYFSIWLPMYCTYLTFRV